VPVSPGRRLLTAPAFLGLLATNFVLGLTSSFIAPFGSLWATQEIGMSARTLGLFMTINSLSAIVISTLLARWSDTHLARRTLLLVGAGAGAVGTVGYALVRDPILLTLIGSTALAVASMNFAQLFAHVREEIGRPECEGSDAPFLMGVLRACYALAWIVGPNLGARIKEWLGYPGLLLTAAGFFVLFIGFVLRFVAHRPRRPKESSALGAVALSNPGEGPPNHGISTLPNQQLHSAWGLTRPIVLAHCVAFGFMFAANTLNALNLPLYLTQKLGGTEQSVGAAFSISPLFEMLFMIVFGHVAARGHQKSVIVIGASAAVSYYLLLRFVTAPWHVYPLQILYAAGAAVTLSVAIPFFQDLLPGQAGVATNLYSNALKVGGLVGFSAFGLLATQVGNAGLFLVCAGLGATTIAIVALARRTQASVQLAKKAPV
jgi:SET family sugar efflux transporter-like MFS transporter